MRQQLLINFQSHVRWNNKNHVLLALLLAVPASSTLKLLSDWCLVDSGRAAPGGGECQECDFRCFWVGGEQVELCVSLEYVCVGIAGRRRRIKGKRAKGNYNVNLVHWFLLRNNHRGQVILILVPKFTTITVSSWFGRGNSSLDLNQFLSDHYFKILPRFYFCETLSRCISTMSFKIKPFFPAGGCTNILGKPFSI